MALRIPFLIAALPVGVYIDATDRRRALVLAGLVRTATIAVLMLAIAVNMNDLPILYISAFMLGSADTVYDSAKTAVIPAIVGREPAQLNRANGQLLAIQSATQYIVAPPTAGYLFGVAILLPFGVSGAGFAVSAAFAFIITGMFQVRIADGSVPQLSNVRTEIARGLTWLWRDELMRSLAIIVSVLGLAGSAVTGILVVYSRQRLGLGDLGFGILLAAGGVGSFLGSLSATPISRRIGDGSTLIVSIVVAAVTFIGMALTRNPTIAGTLYAIDGWSVMLWGVVFATARQAVIPDHFLGRSASAYRLMSAGSMPIGAAIGGILARIDLRAPFLAAGAMLLLLTCYAAATATNRKIKAARLRMADP